MRWVACLIACTPAASVPPAVVAPPPASPPPPPAAQVEPTWTAITVPCAKVAALSAKSPALKWSARASGTAEDLTAIDGSDAEVTIVGAAGVVLRASLGGFSIERCTLTEDLHSVASIDGEAWIGGASNLYRRTAKGWFARSPATGRVTSISAISRDDVWLVANNAVLHATSDGAKWTADKHCLRSEHVFARSPSDLYLECSFFVERSMDGGATWASSAFEPHVESGFRIHGVASDIWIAGTAGTIDASFDGGATFTPVIAPVTVSGFHDVWSLGQGRAILVGSGVHTRFGKTWTTELADDVGINAVWATSPFDVWAVGRGGTLLHRP